MIRCEHLTKVYNDVPAVDDLTLEIPEGEIFGLLGPNGAGKSTTMRMVQCVSPRTGGRLDVFGMDPAVDARTIKARLGVVPQENNLDTDLTGAENLLAYARYFGIPRRTAEERVARLLAFVQMEGKKDVVIENLSGGMRRRLILSRALVNDPDILILDEPTTGLDPQARHLIWERLRTLQQEGTTIVLTTHSMEEAEHLCDRLVIMDHGEILVEGSPKDLIRTTIGGHIIEAAAAEAVIACLRSHGIPYETAGSLVHVPTDRPNELTRTLLDACGAITLTTRPATLEDVFLKLTGRTLRE